MCTIIGPSRSTPRTNLLPYSVRYSTLVQLLLAPVSASVATCANSESTFPLDRPITRRLQGLVVMMSTYPWAGHSLRTRVMRGTQGDMWPKRH
ncbi:hypothetical protein HD554DRAFT_1564511 [Boletus coccyginus]|nr:hypothetical protein HD554DRAFT_1564511 [Boletus coccyginus]